MLKTLVLIVFSISLFAKDIPIQRELTIEIPLNEYSIIEMPFKIISKDLTPFKRREKVENSKLDKKKNTKLEKVYVRPGTPKKIKVTNLKTKKIPKKEKKSLDFQSSENILKFYPRKEGEIGIVLWGYDYPIMLKIITKKELEYKEKYFKFYTPEMDKKDSIKFENNYHERVLTKLLKALYKNTPPGGYKVETQSEEFVNNGINFSLNTTYAGQNYKGQIWNIENLSDKTINLYEEMFSRPDVFLISFESNILKVGEATRLFVITKEIR